VTNQNAKAIVSGSQATTDLNNSFSFIDYWSPPASWDATPYITSIPETNTLSFADGPALSKHSATTRATATTSTPKLTWLFGPNDQAIASNRQASADLNGSSPFIEYSSSWSPPAAWDANTFTCFTSLLGLESWEITGNYCKYVMYDDEDWQFTPINDQQNPAGCIKMAAEMVHQEGMKFISAPGIDIVNTLDPGNTNKYAEYLKLNIPAMAAKYADVFVIQAQLLENVPAAYTSFVQSAMAEARAANPHVEILAGLTTQVNGVTVDPNTILADINATRGSVSGYWFNIPTPGSACDPSCTAFTPNIAISVIHALG